MRKTVVTILIVVASLCLALSIHAKDRKLPPGAYIKSAKIDIISGDLNRYPSAEAMLDSLMIYYGPNAEALFLLSQMQIDYMESQSDPKAKLPYIKKMVALVDSLHACCNNDKIDKKYRKDCDVHTAAADSIKVKYWREFYNAGTAQVNEMADFNDEKSGVSDSSTLAYYDEKIQAKFDSAVVNMEIAMTIDPTQNQSFIGLGSAYQQVGQNEKAVEWLSKGLVAAKNASPMVVGRGTAHGRRIRRPLYLSIVYRQAAAP